MVPHAISDDNKKEILNKLKELCLHEKVSESTSKMPEELTKINLEQGHKVQAQVIQRPYGVPSSSKEGSK